MVNFYNRQNTTNMTSSVNLDPDWRFLPDLVRDEIMLKVGLDNLESLHRCRQVCRAWNTGILTNIWESPSKVNEIRAKIEKDWSPGMWPPDHQIRHAKWLGKYSSSRIFI